MKRSKTKQQTMYEPIKDKNLRGSLLYTISSEFPKIGGPRVVELCTEMILEIVHDYLKPKDHLRWGQVLYSAVSVNDPPARGKTMAETEKVVVVLDLVTDEDIEKQIAKEDHRKKIVRRCKRLCQQAYEQGGLLTTADLSLLIGYDRAYISRCLAKEERDSGEIIPRRANIHDMGTGTTHKRIICLYRFRDGLSAREIARRTHHADESVKNYLSTYKRVRHLLQRGIDPAQIPQMLDISTNLAQQYVEIHKELTDEDS